MDPINLLLGINLVVTFFANASAIKKSVSTSFQKTVDRPKTYLQKTPLNVSAFVIILILLGIFEVGTLPYEEFKDFQFVRVIGLILFAVFTWAQIAAVKKMGKSYTTEIVIVKDQKIINSGIYKIVRHPQYLFQIAADLSAGLALLSYLVVPVTLFVELPLLIARAKFEENLFMKKFPKEYAEYRKKSGFFLPYI